MNQIRKIKETAAWFLWVLGISGWFQAWRDVRRSETAEQDQPGTSASVRPEYPSQAP